jgi:hypothetical protein
MLIGTIALSLCALILLLIIVGLFTGGNTFTRIVALGFDMFCNVITGGQLDVTISSRSGIAQQQGKKLGKFMVWWLDKLQKDHCNIAIHNDIDRAKAVIVKLSPYDTRTKN